MGGLHFILGRRAAIKAKKTKSITFKLEVVIKRSTAKNNGNLTKSAFFAVETVIYPNY